MSKTRLRRRKGRAPGNRDLPYPERRDWVVLAERAVPKRRAKGLAQRLESSGSRGGPAAHKKGRGRFAAPARFPSGRGSGPGCRRQRRLDGHFGATRQSWPSQGISGKEKDALRASKSGRNPIGRHKTRLWAFDLFDFGTGPGRSLVAGFAGTKRIPGQHHGRGLGGRASPGTYIDPNRKIWLLVDHGVGARVYRKPGAWPQPQQSWEPGDCFLGRGATPRG